jgi:hypothetical protein
MSIEKNQLFKVGDKVKILPTILAVYPDFPYVGAAGRVCTVTGNGTQIGVEFSCPRSYLHDWCLRSYLEFIPDNLPDIWEYIK